MSIFSPASPQVQAGNVLQAQEKHVTNSIPPLFKEAAPKVSPVQIYKNYLTSGDSSFKDAAGTALDKLQSFANNAMFAASKVTSIGIDNYDREKEIDTSVPSTTPDHLKEPIFQASQNAKYATPEILSQIVNAENKPGDAHAIRVNTDGSKDYGLFQINSSNFPMIQKQFKAQGQIFDPFNPVDSAKAAAIILEANVNDASRILGRPLTHDETLGAYNSPGNVVKAAREDEKAQKRLAAYTTNATTTD